MIHTKSFDSFAEAVQSTQSLPAQSISPAEQSRQGGCGEHSAPHFEHDTLLVVDWDDTLFPTSLQHTCDPEDFELLDAHLVRFLMRVRQAFDLVVLTNGSEEWFDQCLDSLPQFRHLLEYFGIYVLYGRAFDDQSWKPHVWKELAFEHFLNFQSHHWPKVTILGDTEHDDRFSVKMDGGVPPP